MKKLIWPISILAGGMLILFSLGYSKVSYKKNPEFLTKIGSFNPLKAQKRKISQWEKRDKQDYNFMLSNDLWSFIYGGDEHDVPCCAQKTPDGGIIIGGYSWSFGGGVAHMWIIKVFPNGEIEWQKIYTEGYIDSASSIQETADGGYIVAGDNSSAITKRSRIWTLKLDSKGEIEWQKIYGGDQGQGANSIGQTINGGYIVAGYTTSFGMGSGDFWVLKLYPDGSIDWQKTYGGENWDMARAVIQTTDGGYAVVGDMGAEGANFETQDIWLLKLSSQGEIEWQKKYGGNREETSSYSILQTIDGGYIVSSQTKSFGAGSRDGWVLKLYPNGEIEWQKAFGGPGDEYFWTTQHTQDGGYIFAGYTYSFGGGVGGNMWVLKLSSTGEIEWQKTYGGSDSDDGAKSIQETSDGGFFVAGQNWFDYMDFMALKISPKGEANPEEISSETNAAVTDTNVAPSDTNVIPIGSDVVVQDTDIVPFDTHIKPIPLFIPHPPVDTKLEREINRSLFRKEAFHTIKWARNPLDSNFRLNIDEYRIYRKEAGQSDSMYQQIGSVPHSTFDYSDNYLDINEKYLYVVTAIDSKGRESERSEPVGN